MKIVQKLEFFTGMLTLTAAVLAFYFVDMSSMKGLEKLGVSNQEVFLRSFIFLLLPSLLITVSSYIHAMKSSKIALLIIIILGGIISFFHLIAFLIGSAFEGHIWIGVSPGFFAFVTIILALCNTFLSWKAKKFS